MKKHPMTKMTTEKLEELIKLRSDPEYRTERIIKVLDITEGQYNYWINRILKERPGVNFPKTVGRPRLLIPKS